MCLQRNVPLTTTVCVCFHAAAVVYHPSDYCCLPLHTEREREGKRWRTEEVEM